MSRCGNRTKARLHRPGQAECEYTPAD
ncbi:hypothetical protein [Streptomyces caniscabiei]